MKYKASDFQKSMPAWKIERDSIADKVLYRRISYIAAAFMANKKIKANDVSIFSIFVGIISVLLIGVPSYRSGLAGSILLIFWIILDDTDGNIARVAGSQPYGEYLDAVSSYILIGFLFFSLGIRSYFMSGQNQTWNIIFVILGGTASVCGVLMSLMYQKFVQVSLEYHKNERLEYDFSNSSPMMKLKTKIDMNMSVGGFLPLLVLLAIAVNRSEIVVVIWFFYYFFEFIATAAYFVIKTKTFSIEE